MKKPDIKVPISQNFRKDYASQVMESKSVTDRLKGEEKSWLGWGRREMLRVMNMFYNTAVEVVTQVYKFVKIHQNGSDSTASAQNVGDLGSIPGLGRSPGEGNGNPLQYSCLENPMDRESW